jgi:hypothetical protein
MASDYGLNFGFRRSDESMFQAAPGLGHDSLDLGSCKVDQLSVMWAGVGTKVWFKNTAAYSRGTRSKAAVNIVDLTGVAVGNLLGWDGTKWVKEVTGATPTPGWLTVTLVTPASNYVEAVCTF